MPLTPHHKLKVCVVSACFCGSLRLGPQPVVYTVQTGCKAWQAQKKTRLLAPTGRVLPTSDYLTCLRFGQQGKLSEL